MHDDIQHEEAIMKDFMQVFSSKLSEVYQEYEENGGLLNPIVDSFGVSCNPTPKPEFLSPEHWKKIMHGLGITDTIDLNIHSIKASLSGLEKETGQYHVR